MTAAPSALTGRRILLTRSAEDCVQWAAMLERRGAIPVQLPCIRCDFIDTAELRAQLPLALQKADWLVLTSRRGVEALASLGAAPPPHTSVAVVGAATATAASQRLERVDLIGGGTGEKLADLLIARGEMASRPNVLLALAENASDVIERKLTAAGAHCVRLDVYRTVPADATLPKRALSTLEADNVVLASPTAVTGFVRQVELDIPANIYTIGPSTTAAARALGLAVTAEAREPSLEGILEAMQWRKRKR